MDRGISLALNLCAKIFSVCFSLRAAYASSHSCLIVLACRGRFMKSKGAGTVTLYFPLPPFKTRFCLPTSISLRAMRRRILKLSGSSSSNRYVSALTVSISATVTPENWSYSPSLSFPRLQKNTMNCSHEMRDSSLKWSLLMRARRLSRVSRSPSVDSLTTVSMRFSKYLSFTML